MWGGRRALEGGEDGDERKAGKGVCCKKIEQWSRAVDVGEG